MDYYWEIKAHNSHFVITAYFTKPNGVHIAKHVFCETYDEIEEYKQTIMDNTKSIAGGAWRPIENAVWRWGGRSFVLDESQMELIPEIS